MVNKDHAWLLRDEVPNRHILTEIERFAIRDIYCSICGVAPETLDTAGPCVGIRGEDSNE